MDIKHETTASGGTFYIEENNKRLGEMSYTLRSDSLISIDHTKVSEALKGKGAGKQLVSSAVDYARANNVKIKSYCSFAQSVFDRVKEFQDVAAL
jgi:predicted GNAT family acetyltransferase